MLSTLLTREIASLFQECLLMSILNSLNKVLVLSTVVLCLSVNAAPFSPPVNAPPFSPPDHKPYVVEAVHITHTTESLL